MKRILKKIKYIGLPIAAITFVLIFSAGTARSETEAGTSGTGPLAVYVGPVDPLQENIAEANANDNAAPSLVTGTEQGFGAEYVPDPLLETIETALVSGTSVEALFAELFNTGESEFDLICAFLRLGIDPSKIIIVALDYGVSASDVHVIAKDCGANNLDVQVGYSMAGDPFTTQGAEELDKGTEEYIYDTPSPSQ